MVFIVYVKNVEIKKLKSKDTFFLYDGAFFNYKTQIE